MSKAKELARAIKEESVNYEASPSLRQLVDTVLEEPEKKTFEKAIEEPYDRMKEIEEYFRKNGVTFERVYNFNIFNQATSVGYKVKRLPPSVERFCEDNGINFFKENEDEQG